MKKPAASIIINCYNGAKHLRQAIESVRQQTIQDWEIILWDNQSQDESAQISYSFNDPRIKYFLAERHTPLGEARNLAMEQAAADWIAFLDCDDIWDPRKLEKQLEIISQSDESLGIVYGRTMRFTDNGQTEELIEQYRQKPLPEGSVLKELLWINFIPLVSAIIRKSAFIEAGLIPRHFKQAEDYYLFASIAARNEVRAVQEVCCHYRVHNSNLSHIQKTSNFEESKKVVAEFLPLIRNEFERCQLRDIRMVELATWEGLMTIKQDKHFWKGIRSIVSEGSLIFAVRLYIIWLFKQQFKIP